VGDSLHDGSGGFPPSLGAGGKHAGPKSVPVSNLTASATGFVIRFVAWFACVFANIGCNHKMEN
jgi:hypothetical protein